MKVQKIKRRIHFQALCANSINWGRRLGIINYIDGMRWHKRAHTGKKFLPYKSA